MEMVRKIFIGFLVCCVFNLFVTLHVFSSLQYEETDDSGHSFKNWNTQKYDLAGTDKTKDRSWLSRNKWWVLLGVVIAGGGAAAAAGGGGGGGGDGDDDDPKIGSADVTW